MQLVLPHLCCSCCFSEAPNLARVLRSILLGFWKKRSVCSQSTLKADFISSLLRSNSQPQIVIRWCLQSFLQPNYPRFSVQFKRLVPGLAPSCQSWSAPILKGVCAWRRDLGSLLPRRGGWERICIAHPQHLPGASSAASVSAPIRRD